MSNLNDNFQDPMNESLNNSISDTETSKGIQDQVGETSETYSASTGRASTSGTYIVNEIGETRPGVVPPSNPGKTRHGMLKTLSLVLVGAVLGSGITMASSRVIFGASSPTTIVRSTTAQPSQTVSSLVTAPAAEIGTTPENIVAEKVTPSVVGITTQTKVQQSSMGFFGFGFPNQGGTSIMEGVGSGVIVSSDGYILTNSHVVGGDNTKLQVVFTDKTSVEGKVLWSDDTLDLAIVKVDVQGLTPVEIGSSSSVKVGDKAIAIGNPLGLDLQSTLTSGYISGLDRSINLQDGGTMTGLIQTDAAINEGNSGGALLNSAGQLIAINTAKAGGTTSGIGFAIPIDTAKPIIEKVMAGGSFQSVYLGIGGMNAANVKALGEQIDYKGDTGIYVMEVMAGTAADKAGIQKGDVITAIDQKPVASMTELKKVLLNYSLGDTVEITLSRNNKDKTVKLTFEQDSSNIDQFNNQPNQQRENSSNNNSSNGNNN